MQVNGNWKVGRIDEDCVERRRDDKDLMSGEERGESAIGAKVGKEEESCLLIMARSNESVKSLSMIQPIESVYIGEEYFANLR